MASSLCKECAAAHIGCTDDKKRLAEIIIEFLEPIRKQRKIYSEDMAQVKKILDEGDKKAHDAASDTMAQVKKLVGLA
jgi:tryptophanyl-tRNA synthetase